MGKKIADLNPDLVGKLLNNCLTIPFCLACLEVTLGYFKLFLFSGYTAGRIIMAMVCKYAILVSFNTVYIISSEIFPTSVR